MDDVAKTLKPYREKIDALDVQIVTLLRDRYSIIEEVGHLKAQKNIPPILQDRVDEVRENAATLADELGLDTEFIRSLYAQLIAHSCELEEKIRQNHFPKIQTDNAV